MNELILMVNIYLIIGIMITLSKYEELALGLTNSVKNNAVLWASVSTNKINRMIKYLPLLTILIWPIFIIGFTIAIIEGITKLISK